MRALQVIIFSVLTLIGGLFLPGEGLRAAEDSATCDPDFLDVMEARAWMEGKREMEVAQKFILKPDSVLEYSCYDLRVPPVGIAADDLFSDNIKKSSGMYDTPPPNPPGGALTNQRLDDALKIHSLQPMAAHLQNYSHAFGGGSVTGITSTCDAMYAVWNFLKCQNFDIADFRSFQDLVNEDPRTLPAACEDNGRSEKWSLALAASAPPPAIPPVSGGMESVVNYFELLDPAKCSGLKPILTGVMVIGPGSVPLYEEAVCSAPGCYYDGDGKCN